MAKLIKWAPGRLVDARRLDETAVSLAALDRDSELYIYESQRKAPGRQFVKFVYADGAACLTTGLGECREAGWKLVITTGRSRYSFARAAVWQTPQDIGETAEQEGELTRDVQL